MFTAEFFARAAFLANILILLPVLISLFKDERAQLQVFEFTVENSSGLRMLVGSLWLAILLLSVAGLGNPKFFIPVLMLQVIYKANYLLFYVLPRLRNYGLEQTPRGLSLSFLIIVVLWPAIIIANL
ncbi:MAG: hypothetical protein C0469_13310 [Cyanobacteria bacterium DS2.3.42]|nr:hypothetical protein [Cyanobacteria bacterium DS2.3.42]